MPIEIPVEDPSELHLSRLKNRPEYLAVARGRRYAVPGLVLQARSRPATVPNTEDASSAPRDAVRIGFTATKKTGNAVRRNRIRRRLKAAAAQVMPKAAKPGYDYVLVGRTATFDRPWQSLLDDLGLALQMVHQSRAKSSTGKQRKGQGKTTRNQTDNGNSKAQ